ncbi:MAG TPA: metal ABC transporter substrate-binding protein [Ilumatobacter sp.]|nr:metal ABC transporter substrate-binding protein [Ilumatobacter sp.]
MRKILTLASSVALALAASACGGDEPADSAGDVAGVPKVVVTTNILGDVVVATFGDLIDVEVIMPAGADPHEFAASAKQATAMEGADLLIVNGAGFEAGLDGVIDSVIDGGTPSFSFADHVELLEGEDHDDEDHDEDHDDEDHEGETEAEHAAHADHGADDPHLWTDPLRIADAVTALSSVIGELPGVDPAVAANRAAAYVAQLTDLVAEVKELLAPIPPDDRVIVTNHEVFGYFADRFDFVVAGAVVPSLTTNAESSAKALEDLADLLRTQSVPVIFAETTQSTQLAEALAAEVGGDVTIVELFTESLGDAGSGADTYLGLMRTDAQLIADALLADAVSGGS